MTIRVERSGLAEILVHASANQFSITARRFNFYTASTLCTFTIAATLAYSVNCIKSGS
jgi:hypothetical protein